MHLIRKLPCALIIAMGAIMTIYQTPSITSITKCLIIPTPACKCPINSVSLRHIPCLFTPQVCFSYLLMTGNNILIILFRINYKKKEKEKKY